MDAILARNFSEIAKGFRSDMLIMKSGDLSAMNVMRA